MKSFYIGDILDFESKNSIFLRTMLRKINDCNSYMLIRPKKTFNYFSVIPEPHKLMVKV